MESTWYERILIFTLIIQKHIIAEMYKYTNCSIEFVEDSWVYEQLSQATDELEKVSSILQLLSSFFIRRFNFNCEQLNSQSKRANLV